MIETTKYWKVVVIGKWLFAENVPDIYLRLEVLTRSWYSLGSVIVPFKIGLYVHNDFISS